MKPLPHLAVVLAGLLLSGCASIDWQRTGQAWLGSLCDAASECSYDADGDPYTRW
tara:strand:+ start:3382 stop:3546 length:165 start_codon:yes stop_codon:yes gene_type:complete